MVKRFNHQHGGIIDVKVSFELLPQLPVVLIGP